MVHSPAELDGAKMTERPKRKIFKKKLEFNESLHWQEERDIHRALYASLQPSKDDPECDPAADPSLAPPLGNGESGSTVDLATTATKDIEGMLEVSTEAPVGQGSVEKSTGMESKTSASIEQARPPAVMNHVPRSLRPAKLDRCHNERKLIRRLYEREAKRLQEEKLKNDEKRQKRRKRKKEKKERSQKEHSLKLACFENGDLKNKKIHAQRKFAVSCSPSSSPFKPGPFSTPNHKSKKQSRAECDSLLSFTPKTEDFLTFLCLRGTPALPPSLELFRKSHQKNLKLQRKESERVEREASEAKQAQAKHQKSILLKPSNSKKSLRQKEKAKAVRTLNHRKGQGIQTLNHRKPAGVARPWRDCKTPTEENKKSAKPRNLPDVCTAPLTPPCLSPIPPPIMFIAEHHNPPPLTLIMPLGGSSKEPKPENTSVEIQPTTVHKAKSQSMVVPETKKQGQSLPTAASPRTTSQDPHGAKTTNAAKEGHKVLLKRKLRSSGEAGTLSKSKRGRKAKVKILKREMTNLLDGQNNGHLRQGGLKARKVRKALKLNGKMGPHGPVTRANKVSVPGAGVVPNGVMKKRRKRKSGRLKEAGKNKTADSDITAIVIKGRDGSTEAKEMAPKNGSTEAKQAAPRRSTRKRIPRFDVQCVYSGLLSNSDAIIQSADCVCACCNAEERTPRKRTKKTIEEAKASPPQLLQDHETRTTTLDTDGNRLSSKEMESHHNKSDAAESMPQEAEIIRVAQVPTAELSDKYQLSPQKEVQQKETRGETLGKDMEPPVVVVEALNPKENTTEGGIRACPNGSFISKSPSPRQLLKERRPLLKSRNLNKAQNVKNGRIYRNGEAIVKKLRNGSSLNLETIGAATPGKYATREDGTENAEGSRFTQERKTSPKKAIPNPLRKKFERQFGTNRPSSPFSHKSRITNSPAVVVVPGGTLGDSATPVTVAPLAASSVTIQDVAESPPSPGYSTNTGSSTSSLGEIPTLRPTPQQWADLTGYLTSQAKTIERYGMCKVMPPEGHAPTGSFPDSIKLTPEIQYVHRLRHRWSSASKRLACLKRHLERKEKVAFQPPQICGCEVDLLKFSELLSHEGGFKAIRAKKKWPKLADQLNIPRNVSGRTNKLETICLKYLVSFVNLSQGENEDLMKEVEVERQHRLDADRSNPFSVAESEVRRVGHQTSLCQFKQRADLLEQIIRAGEDNTPTDIEREFWKIVEESDSYVAAQRSDIQGCTSSRYESNLCDLAEGGSNILSALPLAVRQRLPTLKLGTVYSAEPWRKTSHGLASLEYLHSGNNKIWYSIPGSQADQLERALKEHAAEAKGHLPCLLDKSFIFMLPPEMLQKWGVTVYRGIQHRHELVVQWYDAAASSISCGFHIAESFPFASSEWLDGAVHAFQESKALSQPSLFSLEQLLYLLIENIWQGHKSCSDLISKLLPIFKVFRNKEMKLRGRLQDAGLNLMALADKTSSSPSRGSRSPGRSGPRVPDEELVQCAVCNQHCYFSLVTNEKEDRVYCLEHAAEVFNNGKVYSSWTVYYRLGQEKMSEVMKLLSQAVPTATPTDIKGEITNNAFYPTLGTTVVA